jgi:hypothetical protein
VQPTNDLPVQPTNDLVQPTNDFTVQAANDAESSHVHAQNVATARANILATTPERLTRRYYNSFIVVHYNSLVLAVHYNSFLLQPTSCATWRRAKYVAKSCIAKQEGAIVTKAKDEGYKITKEGNSEEIDSKEAEAELS